MKIYLSTALLVYLREEFQKIEKIVVNSFSNHFRNIFERIKFLILLKEYGGLVHYIIKMLSVHFIVASVPTDPKITIK